MSRPLVVAGLAAVAVLSAAGSPAIVSLWLPLPLPGVHAPAAAIVRAQSAPTDGPGDDLNCDDFVGAGGFRAAQDNLLATWPEDPNGLDANANGIACENVDAFAAAAEAAEPAWITLGLPAPGETPTPTLTPTATPAPATATPASSAPTATLQPTPPPVPAAPLAPTATAIPRPAPTPTPVPLPPISYREALPPELLARVDDCASVAVSRRRLVASGCPDGRIVLWKQPREAPNLKRTAVVRFVNPLDRNRPPRAEETPAPPPAPTL